MNRRTIIQVTYLKNNSGDIPCGEDVCECEQKHSVMQKSQKAEFFYPWFITLLAFIVALFLSVVKTNVMSAAALSDNRNAIVSCQPADAVDNAIRRAPRRNDESKPKNGNSCPHQLGMQCLICDSKRKKNHTC